MVSMMMCDLSFDVHKLHKNSIQ